MGTEIGLTAEGLDAYRRENDRIRAERDTLKAELAEARAAIEAIDPTKLDLLADWFDADDARKAGQREVDVQADLRRWAKMLRALDAPQRPEDAGDPLHTAIECVLLDHEGEIGGDNADANISELAYVYRQRTGWTVEQERPEDTREETGRG